MTRKEVLTQRLVTTSYGLGVPWPRRDGLLYDRSSNYSRGIITSWERVSRESGERGSGSGIGERASGERGKVSGEGGSGSGSGDDEGRVPERYIWYDY